MHAPLPDSLKNTYMVYIRKQRFRIVLHGGYNREEMRFVGVQPQPFETAVELPDT